MKLIRRNPALELVSLHSEMDRVFHEVWQGFGLSPHAQGNGGSTAMGFLPADIERTDEALVVHVSLPGYTPEEVSVTVDQGVLTIDAQHQQQSEQEDKSYVRQERFTGRLYRQIALGEGVKSEEAQASFQNGVLTVTVPLTARPEPKKIPVVAEATATTGAAPRG
jgi:HSP20 family protein